MHMHKDNPTLVQPVTRYPGLDLSRLCVIFKTVLNSRELRTVYKLLFSEENSILFIRISFFLLLWKQVTDNVKKTENVKNDFVNQFDHDRPGSYQFDSLGQKCLQWVEGCTWREMVEVAL